MRQPQRFVACWLDLRGELVQSMQQLCHLHWLQLHVCLLLCSGLHACTASLFSKCVYQLEKGFLAGTRPPVKYPHTFPQWTWAWRGVNLSVDLAGRRAPTHLPYTRSCPCHHVVSYPGERRGGGGCHKGRVSMLVGTSRRLGVCTHSPLKRESSMHGWVGCPPTGLRVKGAGSKIARGGESAHDATVAMSPF